MGAFVDVLDSNEELKRTEIFLVILLIIRIIQIRFHVRQRQELYRRAVLKYGYSRLSELQAVFSLELSTHFTIFEEQSHSVNVDLEYATFSSLHIFDGELSPEIGQRLSQSVAADGIVHGTFDTVI